jgi:hypothetical protein
MMLKRVQTISKGGKFYLEGYMPIDNENGRRQFFSISNKTREETFSLLYQMQADVDKMHPRRQEK